MGQAEPWWKGAVIYQVYPRSFQDSNGDGIGDLPGVTARLPHIAGLGADAVWISPFFTSPMQDFGYDVADYRDVDPIFGTLADIRALIDRAHALGLKVMIDQVISHSSDRHPWFQTSRASRHNARADWYVWADPKPDGSPPNNWQAVFGGPAWTWEPRRGQYYLHNFLAAQPDFNFHNPDVRAALLAVLRFWLEQGVDGFRMDTINYYFHNPALPDNPPLDNPPLDNGPAENGLPPSRPPSRPYDMQRHLHDKNQPENLAFLEELGAMLARDWPDCCIMGEIGEAGDLALDLLAAYTRPGRVQTCYTFDLLGSGFSAAHLRSVIGRFQARARDSWPCWAFSNHDVPRHASRFATDTDPERAARLAILLLTCLEGSLCLYQGEELGLTEADLPYEALRDPEGLAFWPARKGRDGCRTPMVWRAADRHGGFTTGTPWLPVPAAHLARAADSPAGQAMTGWYRQVLALRREPVFRHGRLTLHPETSTARPEQEPAGLLLFHRHLGPTTRLCAFNLTTTRQPRPAGHPLLATDPESNPLPPFSGIILAQGPVSGLT